VLPSYSSHLTCYHPCCRQPPHHHPDRYRAHHVVLYNFPLSVPLRPALTIHEALRSSRHVLLAIIHAAGILIDIILIASYLLSSTPPALTSYSLRRIVQLPTVCPSESYANNSRSSSIFSPRLTCYHPRRWHPHRHRTRCVLLASIHTAGILIDIVLVASYLLSSTPPASSLPSSLTSYSSHRIVQLPTVCPSESCANNSRSSSIFLPRLTCYYPCRRHPHRHRTCRVLLAIIHPAGIFIDIVLVASYCTTSHCLSL